ncbi:MAG: tyrosine-type recombinase/integrase [Treponema sp.]|nr:tyrosine-type recombinase/integrase [Treponema sp.]
MGVKIRENRGKLYLDINWNGQRKWESLRLSVSTDKQQNREIMRLAEICRSRREAQLVSGEWNLLDPVNGKKALYQYLEELSLDRNPKDRTRKVLRYLKSYPGGDTVRLDQVNERWFENFQKHLLKNTGLSGSSANSYAAAVRIALAKAAHENIIPRNPAEAVRAIPVPEADKVFLNPEEIQWLADTPLNGELGREIRKAFLLACFTGLRVSDLKSLTWGDIEYNPLQLIKRQKKTQNKVFVPLHETAWRLINDGTIHSHTDLIFPRFGGVKDPLNNYLYRWAAKAGLEKKIGWHTGRHTFAVLSLENGAEIYTVSKLLGHTNLKTTQVYAKATDKMKREAVNALPKIEIK